MYMLDTNIVIYIMKQNPAHVVAMFDNISRQGHQIVISFVSYAELLKGVENSSQKEKSLKKLNKFIHLVPVIYPKNGKICEYYAKWHNKLKQQGTPIGGNDLWIASHALALNATLVTHNTKEFCRIDELRLEDWV